MPVRDAHRRAPVGDQVLDPRRGDHRARLPGQVPGQVQEAPHHAGGIDAADRAGLPGEGRDLARVAAHARAPDLPENLLHPGSPELCRPHADRIEDHRDPARVRRMAGPDHRRDGLSHERAGVEDQGGGLRGHLLHLLGGLGHHRGGSERQRDVRHVPSGHEVGDVMDERAALAHPRQEVRHLLGRHQGRIPTLRDPTLP